MRETAGLRFGLIPRGEEGGASEREFLAASAAALGREVSVYRAADYRMVLSGLEQGLVDVAWLPPLMGARALRARVVEPVAVAVRQGDTGYRTALVTRVDSPIRSLSDLRNLRVAWVDRESASGYAVLRGALTRAGVQLTDAFANEVFLRSHAAVARAVVEGRVDVGATCTHAGPEGVRFARSLFTGDAGLSTAELRAVFEAGPIPSDLFAVHLNVPVTIRRALERALVQGAPERLNAAARALTHADAFVLPSPEHRRLLESMVEA